MRRSSRIRGSASPMKCTRPAAISSPPRGSWTSSVRSQGQRVDGRLSPLGIGDEIPPEDDLGPPPVGLDVLAQRRRLDRTPIDDDRHRAVGDAGERDLEPRRPSAANDLVGGGRGREVEIDRRLAEREIADRAADESVSSPPPLSAASARASEPTLSGVRSLSLPPARPGRAVIRSVRGPGRRFRHAPVHRRRGPEARRR